MDLWLRPFELRTLLGEIQGASWRSKEKLHIVSDFRIYALPELRGTWGAFLPLIPLARRELVASLTQLQRREEHVAIRQLGELDSVPAAILLRLDFTREIINEALSRLRQRRRE